MSADDPRCQRLSELSQCAYRLGLAFGAEAERAQDAARRLEYFHLFDRCFFAVRVATALELRLRRPQVALAPQDRMAREDLSVRAEHDPPGRDGDFERERDRDREREDEPASLPVLLRTLGGVAADAAALPGPQPAALPTLRELLAEVTSDVTSAAKPPSTGLRTRLAGSATVMTLAPPARPAPRDAPAIRRATGPPRR